MAFFYPTCLTIAGSDSGGGAGIQADLKTMSALGVYGMSVITAVTAQNTQGVTAIQAITPHMVTAQLEAVFSDIRCDAVKIGMLFSEEIITALVEALDRYKPRHIVLDPVMVSTSGHKLVENDICNIIMQDLCPRASLITPNIPEAALLSGIGIYDEEDMMQAGKILLDRGCRAVLIKGGHLSGQEMNDILFTHDNTPQVYTSTKIATKNTHGTGCSLSSAIASYLALGNNMPEAVRKAKAYVSDGLKAGTDVTLGKGHGPINHFFAPQPLLPIPEIECAEVVSKDTLLPS